MVEWSAVIVHVKYMSVY